MLSTRTPISAADIHSIAALKAGTVFQLFGFGDDRGRIDSIVIKQERGQRANDVAVAGMLMSVVDRSARVVVLSPEELQQLKLFAQGGEVPDVAALNAAQDLAATLNVPGAWVKMGVKRLTTLDEAVNRRLDPNNPSKADVRVIARALKKSGGLEKLGEIIAVDLFNGNDDRFGPPFNLNPGQFNGVPLQAVYNVGNVFVACSGSGKGSVIGLDSFGPTSEVKDVDDGHVDLRRWGGLLLRPDKAAEREQYAGLIIADLEALLGPRNRKIRFASQNRLGTGRKKRLTKGMEQGARKLQKAFQVWRRQNAGREMRAGVAARANLLGW